MSGDASRFDPPRFGAADDASSVPALRARINDNMHAANREFTNFIAEVRADGKHPWTEPMSTMTMAHGRWVSHMLWLMAFGYFNSVVHTHQGNESLSAGAERACAAMCDAATDWSVHIVHMQNELDRGIKPLLSPSLDLYVPDSPQDAYEGIWSICDTINYEVFISLERFKELGSVPERFQCVYVELLARYNANVPSVLRFRERYDTDKSAYNRRQVIASMLDLMRAEFAIGQGLWAPYLLGQGFAEVLRRQKTLDGLDLGFDPWILTDPDQRVQHASDATSRRELYEFWKSIANPAAAYQVNQQLSDALRARRIRRRTGHGHMTVPWQSNFLVRIPTQFGQRMFQAGDQIVLYASQDDVGRSVLDVRRRATRLTRISDLLGHCQKT